MPPIRNSPIQPGAAAPRVARPDDAKPEVGGQPPLPSAPADTFVSANGLGFNGFDYREYRDGLKVVPPDADAAKLPTIVRWSDAQGRDHQAHLLSGDLLQLSREVRAGGGTIRSTQKASPGARWVPDPRGDF